MYIYIHRFVNSSFCYLPSFSNQSFISIKKKVFFFFLSSSLSLIMTSPSEKTYSKFYHVEIGIIILFLCLTVPSLIILTLIYRQQSHPPPPPSILKPTFQRFSLTEYPQARCMDQTIASYYIRRATNNHSRWLIYFDGGWFCYSKQSCEFRRRYSPDFISSNVFNHEKFSTGIFSSFKHFNILYAPYCSSDLWSGSSNETHSHGYNIFHAIFHHRNYFPDAKQILFTGYSAGGLGLLLNLPDLLPKFSPQIDLRLILDSAWFIDQSDNPNGISTITQGMQYWNTQISSQCQFKQRYKCLFGSQAIQFLPSKLKIFIIQSLFDLTQLQFDHSNDFSVKLRENLIESRHRLSIFAPSCYQHGYLFRSLWSKYSINQRTLGYYLHMWLKHNKHLFILDENFQSSSCPLNDE